MYVCVPSNVSSCWPQIMPTIQANGLVGHDGRVELAAKRPQLNRRRERRAMAGVHEAHRRPAPPRHEQTPRTPASHRPAARCPSSSSREVQVEPQPDDGAVLLAVVVVAVDGHHHPDQVLAPCVRGQRVAVPRAGREAPDGQIRAAAYVTSLDEVGCNLVVLPGVDVRAVGDVEDACFFLRVATVVGT